MRPVATAVVVLIAALLPMGARAAADPFAWAPPAAPSVVRGRATGSRFGLLALQEVTVEVDNVFAAANRQALAIAEQRMAEVPGVRAVFGPAGLLDLSVDAGGATHARSVLARGESEAEGEAARQRVVRRADALGWYLTEDGRRARFYVDADDWSHVAPGIGAALAASGIGLASPSARAFEARPLWPDPRHYGRWLPALFPAAWVFFMVVGLSRTGAGGARRGWPMRVARATAAGFGAAAPFAAVLVPGMRLVAALAGGAALAVVLLWGVWRVRGRANRRVGTRGEQQRVRTVLMLTLAALAAVGGFILSPRIRVATRQWSAAPMFFVSVRADVEQPVVLREIRRLTDDLRAQPGVDNAWSVADLFSTVALAGDEASHLPDDADLVRRIFVQARTDPAVRLELAADHREAVVGVRFDDDLTVDRAEIMEHLQRYLDLELRRSLLQVDVDAPGAEPAARSFGRSLLAVDGRDRILRICDRSGRALSAAEAEEVQRVARQAATIPVADPTRLTSEIATATRDFIARHPFPLAATDTNHLVAAVTALDARASVDDVRVAVAAAYGTRLPDAILRSTAAGLARRVADVRRRLVARTNFRDMLYGAGLPTEGVLADEVRSATLETMGPIVGVPAAPDNPSALKIDPVAIGGTANDRALSETWEASLRTGLTGTAGLISILLLATAGFAGIFRLPVAFAPLALASAPAALLGEPVGLPTLSFFAGALAAGAVLAVHATPPRHQDGDGR